MPKYLLLLAATLWLHAGVLDFQTITEAQKAYEEGHYEKAAALYATIAGKNDEARFNYADALYKSKQYQPAIEQYDRIPERSALKAASLYNTGNAHAQLGELDKAEEAYTRALEAAKEDALKADIQHNLDIIRKTKENQQQKDETQKRDQDQKQQNRDQNQSNQQNQQQQNDQNRQDQQNGQPQDDRNDQQQQERHTSSGGAASSQNSSTAQQQGQQSSAGKEEERPEKEAQGTAHSADAEAAPISDMEERKYNQMLDKRGIRTLMVPLNSKGEPRENETTPW